ncbi:fimbrillin family protein [Bacteroides sp. OttesenSCG-928-E20]|nr:fimbrillin family protein [Bacteroides sp. OttesenSCG-928-E20]
MLGTKFNPDPADNRLMWPADAVKAHFTAYYLPATHNTAPTEGSPLTIPLAGLSETGTNDDLLLANQDVVNLNGIVLLRFAHTTTKLRFHGLLPAAKEIKLSSNKALNTGIEVSYSADKGYTHEFITDGTNEYSVVKAVGTDDGTGAYTRSVFFIDVTSEWKDATFMLYQYTNAGDTEPIKTTPLTEKNINLYTMQKGRAYYISFYGEPNNDLVAEEDKWYNKGAPKVFETTDQIKAYFAGEGKNGLTQDLDFNNLLLDDGVINFPATRGINFTGDIFNGNNFAVT